MSPASKLKIPKKKLPDLNKPVPLGFDPTAQPPPMKPPVREDTLRLYEPDKELKPPPRKFKFSRPKRAASGPFNQGRL